MKASLKTVAMFALFAVSVMADQTTGGTYNPVNTAWWIEAVVYGIFGAIIAVAILWHCAHGALGSHEGFSKIVNVLIFGAIGFGTIYVVTNMTSGMAPPVTH